MNTRASIAGPVHEEDSGPAEFEVVVVQTEKEPTATRTGAIAGPMTVLRRLGIREVEPAPEHFGIND